MAMIFPADAELINRDPQLTGLSILFDEQTLGRIIQESFPELNCGIPRSYYLRYKPQINCLVAYELPVNGQSVTIYAKAFHRDDRQKFNKWQQKKTSKGIFGDSCLALADYLTVINSFPHDCKIKKLARVIDRENSDEMLKTLFPRQPQWWLGTIESVRYKPERRYVARLIVDAKPQALIKTYTPRAYKNIANKIDGFRSQGNLCIARTIEKLDRLHTISYEWLDGSLLTNLINSDRWHDSIWQEVGSALAQLHQQTPTPNLKFLTSRQQVESLQAMANWSIFLNPAYQTIITELTTQISDRLLSLPSFFCPVHGDFYLDQLLRMGKQKIAILDLDRATQSDPALDLGNCLAHLEKQAIYGSLTSDVIDRATENLLLGYESNSANIIRHRIDLYKALCLFRLLGEPFRSRDPHWSEKMVLILDRIRQIIKPKRIKFVGYREENVLSCTQQRQYK